MIDNKEFLAIKAKDVVQARIQLLKKIDKEIEMFREGKISDKELQELQEQELCQVIADQLENIREEIEETFWIDQLGDLE